MGWRRLAAAAVAVCAVLVAPVPARAAAVCDTLPAKVPVFKGTPVEDQVYAPKRLAPLATGKNVRVAVIDSGVDADHPQLRGKVEKGADFLRNDASGRQDCVGHGTAVASIIAASPEADTGFQGLAPGAIIIPIRITEQKDINGKAVGDRGTPAQFAEAIDWAVEQGHAQVINLSVVMTEPNTLVEAAVRRAVAAGVVIVAAAGNEAQNGNSDPFPADYDGVIGVGAVTADGVRASFSQHGEYVDLVAAGQQVTVAARGAGHRTDQGTSFAAPYVTATVALILERFPKSTPAGVLYRLQATADPAPGGKKSPEYGAGLLNPYRAITESLGRDDHVPAVAQVMSPGDPKAEALARRRAHSQDMALWFAAIGGGLVLLMAATALIVRRGRGRRWQAADPTLP
jgi:type VII secretion-associated serine protease mycosin